MAPPNDNDDNDNSPITPNGALRWIGVTFAIMTTAMSIVWFAADLRNDTSMTAQRIESVKREQEIANNIQDARIADLERKQEMSDRAISDLGRKLDVAVALLERIDAKVGKP